jgi:hypothetical protein
MDDLVLADGLQPARGIKRAAHAASLRNFRKINAPGDAKAAAKMKGCLVYSPSYEIDDGALLDIASSKGAVVFSFSDILPQSGFRRAITLSRMRLLLAACKRAGAGFVFCSLAGKQNETRNERELRAFAMVAGASQEQASQSEEMLAGLVSFGEERKGKP